MSLNAAIDINQLVTGPQKCVVLGPVGELINCIILPALFTGALAEAVAVAVAEEAAVEAVDAAASLLPFSAARSDRVRAAARAVGAAARPNSDANILSALCRFDPLCLRRLIGADLVMRDVV